MADKTYYITTPIYYTNSVPHIGNSYASFLADVLARYKRLLGYDAKFTTGVDENSQKALQKAQEQSISIESFLDMMADKHKEVRDNLDITYTDFIRTSDRSIGEFDYEHHVFVQKVLQKTYDKGDIYQGEYEGLYCV